MKKFAVLILAIFLIACIAQPIPEPTPTSRAATVIKPEVNPYAPMPEDVNLRETGVVLTSLDLSELADVTPLRTELTILGSMPSVCNELRIKVDPPNDAYQIFIAIYSLADPQLNCENVFQQFEASILLGEYSAGQYSVWVNGSFVGDIVSY